MIKQFIKKNHFDFKHKLFIALKINANKIIYTKILKELNLNNIIISLKLYCQV